MRMTTSDGLAHRCLVGRKIHSPDVREQTLVESELFGYEKDLDSPAGCAVTT
jgi:hypothetical protein